ncbi:MAG: hypothetical protein ABSF59_07845 [Candidatus Sulfotelmatobacter sp.]|jgi:hypothetical protein
MPSSRDAGQLLTQLEAAKSNFDRDQAARITKLLTKLYRLELNDPNQLIRFHESLLFLRAFPHSPSLVARVERLLNNFHERIEELQAAHADMSVFDDFDTSGIAGTTMQDILSFDVAKWLVRRIPGNVEIAWNDYWDDYQAERARGNIWPRFIPLLEEDADVEANIAWQRWLDAARGREDPLHWLIGRFEKLPLPPRQQAELYDSLRLPLRWKLGNLKLSRTRNWSRPRRFYFHNTPLLERSQVSLASELAQPAPRLQELSRSAGEDAMNAIREIMVVRYRELYGTTIGDPRSVVRTDLGRGVVMHFWGLPPERRLPLRAYVAGYTLKNGVPINYIEAIGLCEWIEVGFNTFYTYRQGETAWIYAQALRCLRALTGAECFSIYPYQIGENNDEAIDSGAFWFYRKLGFRPGRRDLQELCASEEQKIAVNAKYRTPRRTLKRLAEAHMFYELNACHSGSNLGELNLRQEGFVSGRASRRTGSAPKTSPASAAAGMSGSWDTFSIRTLALRINRCVLKEFGGDSQKIRQAATTAISKVLKISPARRWTPRQRQALENWALALTQIPGLNDWSAKEKQQMVKIIQAKAAASELLCLRLTQSHSRFRKELLRLGSEITNR